MIEAVIMLLIYIALIALVLFLIFWVLDAVGFPLPEQVKKIIIVIAVLICILLLLRVLLPGLGVRL